MYNVLYIFIQTSTFFSNRAYFNEVTILLPASWSDSADYSAPSGETFASANVIVNNPLTSPNVTRVVRPSQDCGTVDDAAQIITTAFALNQDDVGLWAQVRF